MTKDEENKILALYHQGKSDYQIGKEMNYHRTSIRYFRVKRGLPANPSNQGRPKVVDECR